MLKNCLKFAVYFLMGAIAAGCSESDLGSKLSNDQGFNKTNQSQYDQLLSKYVDEKGFVKYTEWHFNSADREALNQVVINIENTNINRFSDNEKLAFYINAYNALTLQLILNHFDGTLGREDSPYPGQRSIRNIENLDEAVWDTFRFKVPHQFTLEGGLPEAISLNELEKTILTSFQDARIHFAINCASVGCPPLIARSYSADILDVQLDAVASNFVNGGIHTVIDDSDPEFLVLETSQIMSWYEGDFANDKSGRYSDVRSFFANYIDTEKTNITSADILECSELADDGECLFFKWEIYPVLNYDWTLNESVLEEGVEK